MIIIHLQKYLPQLTWLLCVNFGTQQVPDFRPVINIAHTPGVTGAWVWYLGRPDSLEISNGL